MALKALEFHKLTISQANIHFGAFDLSEAVKIRI